MSEIPPTHHSRWTPYCKYSDPSIIELLPIVDLLLITLITYLLCLQYHRYTEVRPLASRLLGGNALWILRSNGMLDTKYIQRPNIQGFEAKENKDYNPSLEILSTISNLLLRRIRNSRQAEYPTLGFLGCAC